MPELRSPEVPVIWIDPAVDESHDGERLALEGPKGA
jgi:hypothetical protein